MIGAIIGDIVGGAYERRSSRGQDFSLIPEWSTFSDDTVMTLAVAEAIMKSWPVSESKEGLTAFKKTLVRTMVEFYDRYPNCGYGMLFSEWCIDPHRHPYGSFGNGSAMRVSFVGWIAKSLKEAELLARTTASVTHNHPEGMKGAEAVAAAIYLARTGESKSVIKSYLSKKYYARLNEITYEDLLKSYRFNSSCQGSVPEAIYCFLSSKDFEDCLRKVISIGGDTDTIGAMACSIAEAFYRSVPAELEQTCLAKLTKDLRKVVEKATKFIQSSKS